MTYDDAGGLYDHVVPPHEGVPSDDAPCHLPYALEHGCNKKFDFRRLGERLTSFIISPWIPKGTLIQEPKGKPHSQFEHSSISATLVELFGLPNYLTKRDAWAGSFAELLTLDTPRTDAPMHLPDAYAALRLRTAGERPSLAPERGTQSCCSRARTRANEIPACPGHQAAAERGPGACGARVRPRGPELAPGQGDAPPGAPHRAVVALQPHRAARLPRRAVDHRPGAPEIPGVFAPLWGSPPLLTPPLFLPTVQAEKWIEAQYKVWRHSPAKEEL